MRILHATHHFLPRHRAGVEVYTDRIARAQQAEGHDVVVLTTDDAPGLAPFALRESEHEGLTVMSIGHPRLARAPEDTLGLPEVVDAAQRAVERLRPDVVHLQHLMYLGLPLADGVRRRRIPSVMTLHEYWLLCARGGQMLQEDGTRCQQAVPETCASCLVSFRFGRSPLEVRLARLSGRVARLGWDPFPTLKRVRNAMTRRKPQSGMGLRPAAVQRMLDFVHRRRAAVDGVVASVDHFLAPSRFLMQKFLDAGWPASRITHSPYGVGPVPTPVRAGPADRPLSIGFMGSIVPQKGLMVLVEAQRLLPRGRTEVLVHGSLRTEPGYGARVRRRATPGEVRFAGQFVGGRPDQALSSMDILVVPSTWYENAPVVISEAFSAGVPVVASRLGGMAELVTDGRDGLLFEPGSAEDLARVLGRFLADPTTLRRLQSGIRAPRSVHDDARGLLALYDRLSRKVR